MVTSRNCGIIHSRSRIFPVFTAEHTEFPESQLSWVTAPFEQKMTNKILMKFDIKKNLSHFNWKLHTSVKILTLSKSQKFFFFTWCISVWPSCSSATKFLFFEGEKSNRKRLTTFFLGGETCFVFSSWWHLKCFFMFTPIPGEMESNSTVAYFADGWLTQPPSSCFFWGVRINWINQWNH